MQKIFFFLSLFSISFTGILNAQMKLNPEEFSPEVKESLKELYHDKIGMFIHWGPYAHIGCEWGDVRNGEWIMRHARMPVKLYEEVAARPFNPVKFNADEWATLAKDAGMGFMVITSKHHDGFAMFKSSHPYNIFDFTEFRRDPMKELHEACRKKDINFGFYYSQSQDWHEDGGVGNDWDFQELSQERFDHYFNSKVIPQVKELTSNYNPVYMIWFDTPGWITSEQCDQLMGIVNKNQPQVIINSRIGNGYGHFESAVDAGKTPGVYKTGWTTDLKLPWQTHESVAGSWGYASRFEDLHNDPNRPAEPYIYRLCDIVSKGGVYLLNVAPNEQGIIPTGQANLLRRMGKWLDVNGEAIYNADPSPLPFPEIPITSKTGKIYFHLQDMTSPDLDVKGFLIQFKKIYLLSDPDKKAIKFNQVKDELRINLPDRLLNKKEIFVLAAEYDGEMKISDQTITPNSNGEINLPVSKSYYSTLRISYDFDTEATHRWSTPDQVLTWKYRIDEPGKYDVYSVQSSPSEVKGLRYKVTSGKNEVEVTPKVTNHAHDFTEVKIGEFVFNEAGDLELKAEITHRPESIPILKRRDENDRYIEFNLKGIILVKK